MTQPALMQTCLEMNKLCLSYTHTKNMLQSYFWKGKALFFKHQQVQAKHAQR